MLVRVYQAKTRLDAAFAMVGRLPEDELEVRAHWARYLCVLTSGFLEEALRLILEDFGKRKAHPAIAQYVASTLQSVSGVNDEKLCRLVGSFSSNWREAYETGLQDKWKAHLDSLVANRHAIAHGRWVGVSLHQMVDYYKSVIEVVEWVHRSCCEGK